jgi:hypothetical protein
MSGRTILLLSCFLAILSLSAISSRGYGSGVSSFFWLKPGTQARYAWTSFLLFDDGAVGYPFRCNYSWTCLSVNDSYAVLKVEVKLELFQEHQTHPSYVDYFGTEFLEMAARGDLSFVKRIPMDQVVGRFELYNSSATPGIRDGIGIPSPIIINKEFTVTVELDTMMMVDSEGQPWGKWILWINPLNYPVQGKTEETFVTNWLSRSIDVNISYYSPIAIPLNTVFGQIDKAFVAVDEEPIEDEFLAQLGLGGMVLTYYYEPRTGIYLTAGTASFFDDFLMQQLGVVVVAGIEDANPMSLTEIAFVGDLNSDWQVNISDIAVVATAFNTRPGDARWNQVADVKRDGVINILDLAAVAKAFGTRYVIPE